MLIYLVKSSGNGQPVKHNTRIHRQSIVPGHKFAIAANAICPQVSAQVAIVFATSDGIKCFRHAPNCDVLALRCEFSVCNCDVLHHGQSAIV